MPRYAFSTSSRGLATNRSAPLPVRRALLAERLDALPEVLRAEARLAQRHELALDLVGQRALVVAQRPHDPLVALERQRRVRTDLARDVECGLLQLVRRDDVVHEAHEVR